MTNILTEFFEGGTPPNELTTGNTAFEEFFPASHPASSAKFFDNGDGDTVAQFVSTGGYLTAGMTLTGGEVRVALEIEIDTANPPSSHAYIAEVWASDSLVAQLRYRSDSGILQMRDTTTADWGTPSALINGRHQLYWRVDALNDEHELHVYSGVDLDTFPGTPTHTSGVKALTLFATSTVDDLKFGLTAATTWDYKVLRVMADDTDWPTLPAQGLADEAKFDLLTLHDPDTADVASWEVDATGSTGSTSLAQLSGTTVGTITDTAGVFTFNAPSGTDDLVFRLTAGTETLDFTITRGEPAATVRPIEYTFQGGDATLAANWV